MAGDYCFISIKEISGGYTINISASTVIPEGTPYFLEETHFRETLPDATKKAAELLAGWAKKEGWKV